MTYKINNVTFTLQPETGKWIPREAVGYDGSGHPIYPAVREFEMGWSVMDAASWNQLQGLFDTVSITGTVVVDLPLFAGVSGTVFQGYSGATMNEPSVDSYFEGYVTGVRLVLLNIKT